MANKYLALQKDVFDISKVTVVGSPTITSDGVASGFSGSNYINTTLVGDLSSGYFKIILSNLVLKTVSASIPIFQIRGQESITNKNSINIAQNYTRYKVFTYNANSDLVQDLQTDTSTTSLTPKEVIFEAMGQSAKLTVNYDNGEQLVINNIDMSNFNYSALKTAYCSLGRTNWEHSEHIDRLSLPLFKIYVDNQLVFQPVKPTYLLERRKPKVWNKGQFTIVGNPSISDDGIYTCGNDKASYVKVPFNNTLGSFSLDFEINIPDSTQAGCYLGHSANVSYGFVDSFFNGSGITDFRIRVKDDDGNVSTLAMGASNYLIGIEKINLTFTGTQYRLTRTRPDGVVYTKTVDSTFKPATNFFSLGNSNKVDVPLTTINLKKITNTSDNNLVFDGGADTYVYDPSKFTIVGSPTITEYGVASGFVTNSSYIETDCMLNPTGDWKFEIEFTTSDDITTEQTITSGRTTSYSAYGLLLSINNSRLICYIGSSSRHIIDASTFTTVQPNTKYKWVGEYKNGTYYLSLNGNVYKTLASTEKLVSNKGQYYGDDVRFPNAFQGSIDLPSISITVDGKEVFTGAKEQFYMLNGV